MNTRTNSPDQRKLLKGAAVGAGRNALGASFIHPEDAMGLSIEANLEKVQMDPPWNNATSGLIFWSVSYLKEVYDNAGREQYLEYFKADMVAGETIMVGNEGWWKFLQGTWKREANPPAPYLLRMVLVRSNIAFWGVEGDERALWIRLTQPGPCCLIASQANCKSPGRSSRSTVNSWAAWNKSF